jgi:hypothetical protein
MSQKRDPAVDDPKALAESLRNLQPGQVLVYHRGHLSSAPREIRVVADMARVLSDAKKVCLVRRRLDKPMRTGALDWQNGVGKKGFEYIAVGRGPATK